MHPSHPDFTSLSSLYNMFARTRVEQMGIYRQSAVEKFPEGTEHRTMT